MTESTVETRNTRIPITASKNEFDQFFLPHLSMPLRGPKAKIEYWKIFCYILKVLYTGMQWKELSIDKGPDGKPEIHYTSVYKKYADWSDDGSWKICMFDNVSVKKEEDITLELQGGGGWGNPYQRDPAAVLEDVLDGYVSVEAAERDYGVIIDPEMKTTELGKGRKEFTVECSFGSRTGTSGWGYRPKRDHNACPGKER